MANEIHRRLLDALGLRIAAGEVTPGSVLTLAWIAGEYGASRTVAREAVKVLESIRMVEPRRRVGLIVRPREQWDALDPLLIHWNLRGPHRQRQLEALMELRVAVEPIAARLAAEHATAAQRVELVRLAETLHELGSRGLGASEPYLAADLEFHRVLLSAGGNPFFAALAAPVGAVLEGRTQIGLTPSIPAPGTLEEHLGTARAIADGDAASAEEHSRTHMRTVWGEVLDPD